MCSAVIDLVIKTLPCLQTFRYHFYPLFGMSCFNKFLLHGSTAYNLGENWTFQEIDQFNPVGLYVRTHTFYGRVLRYGKKSDFVPQLFL